MTDDGDEAVEPAEELDLRSVLKVLFVLSLGNNIRFKTRFSECVHSFSEILPSLND